MKKTDVENALVEMNMSPALSGFNYITDAIVKLDTPECKDIKFTALYDEIGKGFNCTGVSVERAIRHAFENIRSYEGDVNSVEKYIGFENTTNSSSLKRLLLILRREISIKQELDTSLIENKNRNNTDELLKKLISDINELLSNYLKSCDMMI